jgi:hypothetical protein
VDDPSRPRTPLLGRAPALLVAGAVLLAACAGRGAVPADDAVRPESRRASQLPDVSGLAWIGGDRFLAVHDAKYPDEAGLVRVSVLELPADLDGIRWTPLDLALPDSPASDLEAVARIPGRPDRFLVAESTEEAAEKPYSNRIFVIEVSGGGASVVDHVDWPVPTTNVEGIAVGEAGGALVFVYAERAHGLPSSEIRWAELTLEPLRFGPFRSAGAFTSPDPSGPMARPVSALEIDAGGALYAASAEDPDDDGGPFRSAVYRIGRVTSGADGPEVALDEVPTLVGTLDGLKVEAIAAREREDGSIELWVGVDDEFFGGTLRRLPER